MKVPPQAWVQGLRGVSRASACSGCLMELTSWGRGGLQSHSPEEGPEPWRGSALYSTVFCTVLYSVQNPTVTRIRLHLLNVQSFQRWQRAGVSVAGEPLTFTSLLKLSLSFPICGMGVLRAPS